MKEIGSAHRRAAEDAVRGDGVRGLRPALLTGVSALALPLAAAPAFANGGKGGGRKAVAAAVLLSAALAAPLPAFADGGAGGGTTGGAGGASVDTGAGGDGASSTNHAGGGGGAGETGGAGGAGTSGSAFPSAGGAGGASAGADGAAGDNHTTFAGAGAGGGGGGAHGSVAASLANTAPLAGGNGGAGGSGNFNGVHGGGGGAGGYGAVVTGSTAASNTGTITGGAGGAGGNGYPGFGGIGGSGGDGGIGVKFTGGVSSFTNSGSITGGNGGAAGTGDGSSGTAGAGGAGIVGANLTIVNESGGAIVGGSHGGGGQANAITFTGGANFLTLQAGSAVNGNIAIDGGGSLTFAQPTDFTFNHFITGNGSLVKTGAGTLTLTGGGDYSGGAMVREGLVSTNVSDGFGTGVITLDGGAIATSTYISNAIVLAAGGGTVQGGGITGLSGDITGGGDLTVSNGDLYLSGADTRTGATHVTTGTIITTTVNRLSAASAYTLDAGGTRLNLLGSDQTIGSLAGAGDASLGSATLTTGGDDTSTAYSGVMSGTGMLIKTGAGTFTLSGLNTYTGTTTVREGTLAVDGGSISQASAMLNVGFIAGDDGALRIENGGTVSNSTGYVGVISGSRGEVTVTGDGSTWTNSGDLYVGVAGTGTLNIGAYDRTGTAGTVTAVRLTTGPGTGTVNFNQTDDITFATPIEGNISVNQRGAGTTTLTGTNTYTGATTVTEGTLAIDGDGSVFSAVTVDDAGSGTATLDNSGSIAMPAAPANTAGTTAVTVGAGGGAVENRSGGMIAGGDATGDGMRIGGTGVVLGSGTLSNAGAISGGRGSNSGTIQGGNGGDGVSAGSGSVTNTGSISGGHGGDGYSGSYAGGGAGVSLAGGQLSNSGSIAGGNAGVGMLAGGRAAGAGVSLTGGGTVTHTGGGITGGEGMFHAGAYHTAGGTGVAISGDDNTLIAGAAIAGGTGNVQGKAVSIDGNGNTLELRSGYSFSGGIAVSGSGNTLALGGATDTGFDLSTLAADFAGFDAYAKRGASTWTLTGITAATGGWTVESSVLAVNGSIADSAVTVQSGATLAGNGTVGSTTVQSGGTLAAGNSIGTLNVAGDLTLSSGSFLDFELGSPGTAADPASGKSDRINVSGNLALDGTVNLAQSSDPADGTAGIGYYRLITYYGDLTSNTATIGTTLGLTDVEYELQAGSGRVDLFIDAAAVLGDDALQHWQGGNGAWNASNTQWLNSGGDAPAAWAGHHAVFKNEPGGFGGGTVAVEGAQSFEGIQFVDDGYRLEGTGQLVTDAAGSEIRVLADSATIATTIAGTGGLIKTEAGTLILTGTNTYSGATTVSGGKLVVDGSLANSAVTLQNGASLGGSGLVGGLTVDSGGTVAPGNSIGTLNVAGNWTLGAGATYMVELKAGGDTPGTHNDLVSVTGAAALDAGSIIHVTPENGTDDGSTYAAGTTYTVVTSGGLTVAGAGPTISDDFAYLDFTGSSDAGNYHLTSSLVSGATSFCLPGQTRNQCAAGDGAFSLGAGHPVYDAVLNMSAAQAAASLDRLSGEVHASAQSALLAGAGLVRDGVLARLHMAEGSEDPLWMSMVGGTVDLDGDGNAAGLSSHDYGFLAGLDDMPDWLGGWRLGALAGYTRTSFSADGRASSGDSGNAHLGLYGGRHWGPLGLRLGLAQSWHWLDTERTVLGQALSGDTTARTLQAFGEVGYALPLGRARVEPFASAAWMRRHTDGFLESGGTAALVVDGSDGDTGFTTLGLRGATVPSAGEAPLAVHGSLGWRHAFGDVVPESTARFQGGAPFTVSGTPLAEDAAVVEAGFDLSLSETATLSLGYDGQFADGLRAHGGKARLTFRF